MLFAVIDVVCYFWCGFIFLIILSKESDTGVNNQYDRAVHKIGQIPYLIIVESTLWVVPDSVGVWNVDVEATYSVSG